MWIFLILISLVVALYFAWRKGYQLENIFEVTKSNILFVIAHPDDEAMFMTPTIKRLTDDSTNKLYLLCLTSGNGAGIGQTRIKELKESCKHLKFENFEIIDNEEDFPDSMTVNWDANKVALQLKETISLFHQNFDIIMTFDNQGVSSHTNHIAVSKGCEIFIQKYSKEFGIKRMYQLITISVLRKFIGLFDLLISNKDRDGYKLFSYNPNLLYAFKSLSIHHSQFVWFRKFFTINSVYAYYNVWRELK